MKISAQQKAQVRVAIERSAERLFRKHGFAAATTRQIATAAGVATGTVFNYFPTKDHLGLSLLRGALEAGNQDFELHRRGDESLAEELFAYMWACLKRLKRDRAFAGEVLQRVGTFGATPTGGRGTGANGEVPKSRSSKPGDDSVISTNGQDVGSPRLGYLEPVNEIMKRHGITPSSLDEHLLSALWLGIVSFWSRDRSKNQEDSMVILDRSMHLFSNHLLKTDRGNAY